MIYGVSMCLLAIGQYILYKQVKPIKWMDSKESTKQMIIQFALYIIAYLILILSNYMVPQSFSVILQIMYLIFIIIIILQLSKQTVKGNSIPVKAETAKPLLKIVAFTWVGLFAALCCINYILVSIMPEAYAGVAELNYFEIAFDVVYYTFSIMFTYSSNGITPTGIIPKAFEMVEVLLCFIVIGIVLTNTISKVSETTTETTNQKKGKKKK